MFTIMGIGISIVFFIMKFLSQGQNIAGRINTSTSTLGWDHRTSHIKWMTNQCTKYTHKQTNEYIYIRAHSELRENIQHRKPHIKQNKHLHPLGPSWSRHPVLHIHMDDIRQIQAPTYTIPRWVVVFHCRMKAAGWCQCEMPRGKLKLQINS